MNKLKMTLCLCIVNLAIYAQAQQTPVNTNANQTTKNLLNYLHNLKGNGILSGQESTYWDWGQDQTPKIARQDKDIYNITNKYPAVYSSDFGDFALNDYQNTEALCNEKRDDVVNAIKAYAERGSIITMSYHMRPPTVGVCAPYNSIKNETGDSGYITLTDAQIDEMITPGTDQYNTMIERFDQIAGYFKELENDDITILWRPFHEMNKGWFWWGELTPSKYIALWNMMYDRLTNHHGCNNLLWVWSINYYYENEDPSVYYPGNSKVDILGADIYTNFGHSFAQYIYDDLSAWGGGKPITFTENGPMPNVSTIKNTMPNMVYWLTWFDHHHSGHNPNSLYQSNYSDPYTITLDELPDFSISGGGNSLAWNPTPTDISNGDNQITLDYSIDQNGIVLVQLYDENWNYIGQVYENISSGTSQSTLTLNVDNNHLPGSYRLRAELRNVSWSVIDGTQLSEQVTLSGTPPPSGNLLAWSPTPTSISNGDNTITLDYSIEDDGILVVQLYSGWNYIGQVYKNISSGTSQSTLTLNVDNNHPPGNYRLSAELRNASWSVIDGTQLSEQVTLSGTPPSSGNAVSWNPTPTSISNGNNAITLDYSIEDDGILVVQLYSGWNYIGQVYENISAGAGQSTLTLNVNGLSAGDYRIQAELRNSGWNTIDDTQISEEVPFNGNNKIVDDLSQNIHLSPNPANYNIQLTYELSENVQAQIQIHDAFGKLVKSISGVQLNAGLPTSLEVSDLSAGMYFCTLKSDKWHAVKKFVIAR